MFECHIWLMVDDCDFPHWKPFEELGLTDAELEQLEGELHQSHMGRFDRLSGKIRQACTEAGINFDLFKLRSTDGGISATAGFARNHAWPADTGRCFLQILSTLAPATYGVMYMLDTDRESPRGEFDVLKLANRNITQSTDLLVP